MNTEAIKKLCDIWSQPDGLPLKRSASMIDSLIDGYGHKNAHGQVLQHIGGYTDECIRTLSGNPINTNAEVAKLLGISKPHAVLLKHVSDDPMVGTPAIVFTHPEQVLGDQAQVVLAFWQYFESMTELQREAISTRCRLLSEDDLLDWDTAYDAAWDAAQTAIGFEPIGCGGGLLSVATCEIQGAAIIRAAGRSLYFLPLFGFDSPDAVLEACKEGNKQ